MREFDVGIVGAGLAGSIAASILARAGHSVAIVDPNDTYPDEFRCEKLDFSQIAILKRTGIADGVLAVATPDRNVWVSRLGHVVEKRASDQLGVDYGPLVNALRAAFPPGVTFVRGKATAVANSPDRQVITLASGESITVRLVLMASGLSNSLRQSLGMDRKDLSPCHSISFGFDVESTAAAGFPFRALTHFTEHPRTRISYITLFPIGARTRTNLFVYRSLDDPWLREFRAAPEAVLAADMPHLFEITGPFRVTGPVKMRPVDLYATSNYRQPGVVLLGDAFGTACPAAGTGAQKAVIDVDRLCNQYVSRWLATPGMGLEKIAAYYDDPVKVASDERSLARAYRARSMATDQSLFWWAARWATVGLGLARWVRHRLREAWHRLHPVYEASAAAGSAKPRA
jgi:2-polyprenyl-6-methoxyphenol hydroxylase-like FAD-dependent oxidoreductase